MGMVPILHKNTKRTFKVKVCRSVKGDFVRTERILFLGVYSGWVSCSRVLTNWIGESPYLGCVKGTW